MKLEEEYLKYIYHDDLYLMDEPDCRESAAQDPQVVEEENKEIQLQEPLPISFFGNNEKGILIIVEDTSDDLLNQNELDLLMKIVESGLKYSKNDFALVNVAKQSLQQTLEEVPHNFLIIFGIDTTAYFSDQTLYAIHEIDEKIVLFSESLGMLASDDFKKRKLWTALKTMFKI